jgi:ParB family chromosome partitioning protein
MKKRNSLGRGLAAILSGSTKNIANQKEKSISLENSHSILISDIEMNPFQPRKTFDQEKLYELSLSIEQLGIIQPITVRKISLNKYQLISGERRCKASILAGIENIPAYIRIANDQQMLEMALVENIQRENLNPIEIALSYQRLIKECELTQEKCSVRVGKNRSTITNFLRLLKLPDIIQKGLSDKKISVGHARALINIDKQDTKINIFHDIVANGYSVREVEQIAKTFSKSNYKRISKEETRSNQYLFSQQKNDSRFIEEIRHKYCNEKKSERKRKNNYSI